MSAIEEQRRDNIEAFLALRTKLAANRELVQANPHDPNITIEES